MLRAAPRAYFAFWVGEAKVIVLVREFRRDDAAEVNRIAVAAWDQYRTTFTDWPRTGPRFAATANLAHKLNLLIAQDDTTILGFVGYIAPGRPRERAFRRDWATIRMLSVDPIARGHGVGRLLTENCIARAKRDGASVIALHTSSVMEVALALYIRLGFTYLRDIVDRHGVHYAIYMLSLSS
jgi:ribosomal protein S18 acetylase RimI-like enzyme